MRFYFIQKCALHLLFVAEPCVDALFHGSAFETDDKIIHFLSGAVDASVSLFERLVARYAAVPHYGTGCGEGEAVAHSGGLRHKNLGVFGFLERSKDAVALVFLYAPVDHLYAKVFS